MTAAEAIRQEAFEDLQFQVIEQDGEEWFSAEDIGKALGFSEPRKAVLKIYERNPDEFEGLRRVVNLTTWLKSGLKLPYRFTTFNPQGAYLLAILARTPKSKALRRWLAKFMAHDLDRLRAHVAALEHTAVQDAARIAELESSVAALRSGKAGLTAELNRLRKRLGSPQAKALPAPAPHQTAASLPPYECQDDDLVWCRYQDLRRLAALATEAGHPDYAPPWLGRVMEANSSLDHHLDLVRTGFRALQKLLYFPPAGGVRCLSKEEQRLPKSTIRTAD